MVGNTDNIQVKEIVKQGIIFEPIMCCTDTSTVNNIGKEVKYRYVKILECQYLWMTSQNQVKQNTQGKL